MGSFDFIYHGDLYGLDLWHKAWRYGNFMREHNLNLQSRRTICKVNCNNSCGFCSSLIDLHNCVCVFIYIYVVYTHIYCSVYIYTYVKPTLLTFSLLFPLHVLLQLCAWYTMKMYSERVQRNFSVLSVCLVLMFGVWKEFFLQQKGSFWFSWQCEHWLAFMGSSRYISTNKLAFQVPTYTLAFCCLSVTHTVNASMAEIF